MNTDNIDKATIYNFGGRGRGSKTRRGVREGRTKQEKKKQQEQQNKDQQQQQDGKANEGEQQPKDQQSSSGTYLCHLQFINRYVPFHPFDSLLHGT
ncbi:hypothetical protein O0I10_011747 [Lichtheimia ornata]|uniref:Uncharacterized protein n=1 Tax=Lichtheimia ornata TaxID=688661 RepID=A0AAD7UUP2_9FUNG|nr:uncharacterized protein O0I10_011747 [Lichtheimia ornata]KAJ8652601.1 hypothetical protein O0I10_011747 [Lichtheimia ornata]